MESYLNKSCTVTLWGYPDNHAGYTGILRKLASHPDAWAIETNIGTVSFMARMVTRIS